MQKDATRTDQRNMRVISRSLNIGDSLIGSEKVHCYDESKCEKVAGFSAEKRFLCCGDVANFQTRERGR
jgi:hypothetical protein